MSNVTVGTAVTQLPGDHRLSSQLIIQNLGTGSLFIDSNPAVTIATGMKIVAGASFTFLKVPGALYLIADAIGTDVRYIT